MTMTLLGGHHKTAEQQQELREARGLFKERIRNDWDFPPLPAYQGPSRRPRPANNGSGEEERVAGFRFHVSRDRRAAGALEFEVVEWRERVYSSESDSDAERAKTSSSKGSSKSKRSEYKFDGPDSVGAQLRDRRTARKRKRQRDLEKELNWNEGLKHWMCQRDAWAGARTSDHAYMPGRHSYDHEAEASAGSAASAESTPRTSTSSTAADVSSAATTPDPLPDRLRLLTAALPVSSPQTELLVPVGALILPNHPIRRRITPATHTEIYTKIILQARTPSVPINLATLISALIEGWKAAGEWPPKSAGPLEPSIGKRKAKSGSTASGESALRSSVKAVGRVRTLTGTSETSGQRAREEG